MRNKAVLAEYRKFLALMPKVTLYFAADYALSLVMVPDTRNYLAGEVSGNKMPHNTSNAAWNWRVSFQGPQAPLYDIDKSPVAGLYEGAITEENPKGYTKRSTYAYESALNVIDERREKDIQRKLYSKLFSRIYSKIPKVTVYNSIDQLNFGKAYVDNSNVKAASEQLATYAEVGVRIASGILRQFMQGGKFKSTPNIDGLMVRLSQARGN